jgi:sulfate adenylyltransferase
VDTTPAKTIDLIAPYGGGLTDLLARREEAGELKKRAGALPVIRLSERAVCDLELLTTGAFSPLDRFMGSADYRRVLDEMRLASGIVFPIPVTLPISSDIDVRENAEVVLCDARQNPLAIMHVEEIFEWDREEYADRVLNTASFRHPHVTEISRWGARNISGPLRVIGLPRHYDFPELRLTPVEVRNRLTLLGSPNVVAFQTRNPLHRAHEEMTKRAMKTTGGTLLMHPVVGPTKAGDVDHYSRVRSYKILTEKYYEPDSVLLSLLPLAMRFAGPREAVWHALIRRNYGANYFLVGRDHASPGRDEHGTPFYPANAARHLVEAFSDELGVSVVPFDEFVYLPDEDAYEDRSAVPDGTRSYSLSGSEVRDEYLKKGRPLPDWFMRPEVARVLAESHTPRHQQGVCVWFTGLSGAGKSTTAEILTAMLARYGRRVTLLDGDVVRNNLSAGLGFDKAGRDANIRRIGFVAAEIVRHGGVAVCAAISPYRETRNEVRKMFGDESFFEVFVATPLEICEQRDPKGLYAQARAGEIANFTGIDDVYEAPRNAEINIDTLDRTAEENARLIIDLLTDHGFTRADADQTN